MKDLHKLLDVKARIYVVCTGAGAGIQDALWSVPGISQVLVGSEFPYAPEATSAFLGFTPEHYCSAETAIDMAMEAYYRAYKFGGGRAYGVALTASVASTVEHRGDHRAFAATISDSGCQVYRVTLKKGVGMAQRAIDGHICNQLVAHALHESVLHTSAFDMTRVEHYTSGSTPMLARERFLARPFFSKIGTRAEALPLEHYAVGNRGAIFPGAFNPPHEGHFGIAEQFEDFVGGRVAFAVEVSPPHKEALTVTEMLQRAKALQGHDVIFTSGAGLYVEKARMFPGLGILIGIDSFRRMLDPKWGVNIEDLKAGLANTCFVVADRTVDGELRSLDPSEVPEGLQCRRLACRWDVSSSEIRARAV